MKVQVAQSRATLSVFTMHSQPYKTDLRSVRQEYCTLVAFLTTQMVRPVQINIGLFIQNLLLNLRCHSFPRVASEHAFVQLAALLCVVLAQVSEGFLVRKGQDFGRFTPVHRFHHLVAQRDFLSVVHELGDAVQDFVVHLTLGNGQSGKKQNFTYSRQRVGSRTCNGRVANWSGYRRDICANRSGDASGNTDNKKMGSRPQFGSKSPSMVDMSPSRLLLNRLRIDSCLLAIE